MGVLGHKHTAETRAKISRAQAGKKLSLAHREAIGRGLRGNRNRRGCKLSPAQKEILRQANLGRITSKETREKQSRAHQGRKFSAEHKAKLSQAHKGKKLSDEHRRKVILAVRSRSPEIRQKTAQANRGKKMSSVNREKLRRRNLGNKYSLGYRHSPEAKKRISRAHLGKILSNKTRELIRIARADQVTPFRETSIEKQLHNALLGIRINFITHAQIRGINGLRRYHQFDVLIPDLRVAIEADGCYWHCCPEHGRPNDHEDWRAKRARRDREIDSAVRAAGWQIIRLWEHEINGGDFSKLGGIIPQGV